MKRRKGLQGLPPDTTIKDARTLGQEYTAQRFLEARIKLQLPIDKPIGKRLRAVRKAP